MTEKRAEEYIKIVKIWAEPYEVDIPHFWDVVKAKVTNQSTKFNLETSQQYGVRLINDNNSNVESKPNYKMDMYGSYHATSPEDLACKIAEEIMNWAR